MPKKQCLALFSLTFLLMTCLLVNSSAYAENTIYRCKLLDGRYQYQQSPCSDSQVSGDTKAHKAWHKMRALNVEGEEILQRLGPDVESIKQCNADMREFQGKLNSVNSLLRSVKENEHPLLFKSYTYLQECAECRTSAVSSCQVANRYLDEAMADLMKAN